MRQAATWDMATGKKAGSRALAAIDQWQNELMPNTEIGCSIPKSCRNSRQCNKYCAEINYDSSGRAEVYLSADTAQKFKNDILLLFDLKSLTSRSIQCPGIGASWQLK